MLIGVPAIVISALGAPALYIDGGELTTWNGLGPGLQTDDNASDEGDLETLPGKDIRSNKRFDGSSDI